LKDGCVGQQAMMSMQSGDADEPRQQMTGGAVWCRHFIQKQPAQTLCAA